MSVQAKTGGPSAKKAIDVCRHPWQEEEDIETDECHTLEDGATRLGAAGGVCAEEDEVGEQDDHLQKNEDHVGGIPSLYGVTSMGKKVDDEGETDAMEDVIEKDLCNFLQNKGRASQKRKSFAGEHWPNKNQTHQLGRHPQGVPQHTHPPDVKIEQAGNP